MKFMAMHKHDAHTEAGRLPTPEFMQRMGAYIGAMAASGQLVEGEGLGATKTRSRVSIREGRATVAHGPYAGRGNELPASVAKIATASREEAIAWATALGRELGGDVELEVGKITEPWDLGLAPAPPGAPERYLVINKITGAPEADRLPALVGAAARVTAPATVLAEIVLTPTSQGKRIVTRGASRSVVDGPFTESKELIGGYAVLEMTSMEACLASCLEYCDILRTGGGDVEIDLRPLHALVAR
ncbi:MAG: hypothetical protein IT374_11365 [Polyangiaceae bacterium]|nr:hypothetical protein [Polyangiaceae bacterium]